MYCENCGKELGFNEDVCSKCGSRVGGETVFIQSGFEASPSSVIYNIPAKNAGYAVLFSFLFAGLGQLYVGKIVRGLLIMLGYAILGALAGGILALGVLVDDGSLGDLMGGAIVSIICMIAMIAFWVWNLFDAHKLANQYNDALVSGKKRPW